jgi:hypothetical protein
MKRSMETVRAGGNGAVPILTTRGSGNHRGEGALFRDPGNADDISSFRRRAVAVIHEDSASGILDEEAAAQGWNRRGHGAGDKDFELEGGALNGQGNDIGRIGQKLVGLTGGGGLTNMTNAQARMIPAVVRSL